ncbi:MAG: hypothetical protein MUC59_03830 [Saprospiraceae bacterium]|jgi:hypothetical protein|nr:hypothetical protein [Saprospiraceae bacterium]
MAEDKAPISDVENSVLIRSVGIASFVLAGIFIALLFFQDNLAKVFGSYADEATIGLMLVGLWLVVSSSIRTAVNHAKGVETWKLVLGGILTGLIGSVLTTAFLIMFPNVAKSQNMAAVTGATGGLIFATSLIAFLITLFVVINIRVKSRALGNLLEFLLIGATIAGLVWYATK